MGLFGEPGVLEKCITNQDKNVFFYINFLLENVEINLRSEFSLIT